MKKLTLTFFALLTFIAFRAGGWTSQFCGERGLEENCSFEDAIKAHKADDKVLKTAQSFVGSVIYKKPNVAIADVGTGFIVRTENCRDNDIILTNAHVGVNEKNNRLKEYGKFCLLEKNKCSEIDSSETAMQKMKKFNLVGDMNILDISYVSEDFVALFLKKPIKTEKVLDLSYISPDEYLNKENILAGINYTARGFRNKTVAIKNCGIKGVVKYQDERLSIDNEIDNKMKNIYYIKNNCHSKQGMSGSPHIYQGKVFAVQTSGYNLFLDEEGVNIKYDPVHRYNAALPITQELVDSLNNYCASRK